MKLRWPPMAEGGTPRDRSADEGSAVTLPAELYWKHVLPHTPVQDRVVINRRSASTQLYAGVRVEIDVDYLRSDNQPTYTWTNRTTGVEETKYLFIPRFKGEPGSNSFQIGDCGYRSSEGVTDPNEALRLLREARYKWDAHLSKISSPSMRLHACLDLLSQDDVGAGGGKCPLLFAGDGVIRDVVRFHASMDASSIQGPPGVDAFPDTPLGHWADVFLNGAWDQLAEGVSYDYVERARVITEELLRAGADATHFLRPLASPPPGGGFYFRYFEPGDSILQSIASYARAEEDLNRHFLEVYGDGETYDGGDDDECGLCYEFVELVGKHARTQLAERKAQGKRAQHAKRKARVL